MLAGAEEALSETITMSSIRALMSGMIDYAGLFPPAALDMKSVVRNYSDYISGDNSWALGGLIVPAARLVEFIDAFNEVCCGEREKTWLLSVLGSDDPEDNATRISGFTQGAILIDAVEMKAATPDEAEKLLSGLPDGLIPYVEFPPSKASEMLPLLARNGARAKIRLGGLTAEAIPDCATVAQFLIACADAQVPFKATAGLHHAIRDSYPLTYEPGSPSATMHGFVNVFLAAAQAWIGKEEKAVIATLEEDSAKEFHFTENNICWHKDALTVSQIGTMRRDFGIDFGSCSFEEPIEEVTALGWL
jgi:hypothetical protein